MMMTDEERNEQTEMLRSEIKQEDFDFSDEFDFAMELLKRFEWLGVMSGVEGLCIECYRSPEQGHAEDCLLDLYLKRVNER